MIVTCSLIGQDIAHVVEGNTEEMDPVKLKVQGFFFQYKDRQMWRGDHCFINDYIELVIRHKPDNNIHGFNE